MKKTVVLIKRFDSDWSPLKKKNFFIIVCKFSHVFIFFTILKLYPKIGLIFAIFTFFIF